MKNFQKFLQILEDIEKYYGDDIYFSLGKSIYDEVTLFEFYINTYFKNSWFLFLRKMILDFNFSNPRFKILTNYFKMTKSLKQLKLIDEQKKFDEEYSSRIKEAIKRIISY